MGRQKTLDRKVGRRVAGIPPSSLCSQFLLECDSDSLDLSPNIWIAAVSNDMELRESLTFKDEKKLEVFFYPVFRDSRESFALWNVPRLRPFVLLVKEMCG